MSRVAGDRVALSPRRAGRLLAAGSRRCPPRRWRRERPPRARLHSVAGSSTSTHRARRAAGAVPPPSRRSTRPARSASRAPTPRSPRSAALRAAERHRRRRSRAPGRWTSTPDGTDRVQVVVDDATGQIRESWTGYQIAWQMARGYSGQFGHKLNAPYVWMPLAAIFLLGLFDFRRWRRIVHLDLLVLLSLRDLGDLLQRRQHRRQRAARLSAARLPARADDLDRLSRAGGGLRPSAPTAWLAIGGAFLLGFRIALNIADSGVIDVGYAGVIGADHITHGQAIWGELPLRQPVRRHLRPVQLLRLRPVRARAAVERHTGTTSRLPTRRRSSSTWPTVAGLFVLGRRSAWREGTTSASSSASHGPPTRSPTTRSSRTRTTP